MADTDLDLSLGCQVHIESSGLGENMALELLKNKLLNRKLDLPPSGASWGTKQIAIL